MHKLVKAKMTRERMRKSGVLPAVGDVVLGGRNPGRRQATRVTACVDTTLSSETLKGLKQAEALRLEDWAGTAYT